MHKFGIEITSLVKSSKSTRPSKSPRGYWWVRIELRKKVSLLSRHSAGWGGGGVFTDRLRKSVQRDFSTIKFGGLGFRVLVVVRGWVRVTVGARVMVGVGLVRG